MRTIKDIAKAVGVSRGSVDRALHGRAGISEATKRRILKKAEEMGYRPNHIARALVLGSKISIGVIVQSKNSEAEFWLQIKEGVDRAANEILDLGAEVLWYDVSGDLEEQERTFGELIALKANAIAIAVTNPDALKDIIDTATSANIAVVTFTMDAPRTARKWFVGQDFFTAGEMAGELMGQFVGGTGQVAIITGFYDWPGQGQRVTGFTRQIETHFPNIEIAAVVENHNRPDAAYAITKRLVRDFPELKGIYVTAAGPFGSARALRDLGKTQDIKMICFDVVGETAKYIRQGVIQASIGQDPILQGYTVVQTLFDYLVNRRRPTLQRIFINIDTVCRANIDYFLVKNEEPLATQIDFALPSV
jgi:LacI family transcriptional regulator